MLWVLQANLYAEQGYSRLLEALDRLGCRQVFVKPVPFTDRLLPADTDASRGVDVSSVPDAEIDTTQRLLAMGSYSLAKAARARGWSPGAFLENTSYDAWSVGFGHERLLNPHAWTGKLRDASVSTASFMRPLLDDKSFTGKVYDPDEFQAWQAQLTPLGLNQGDGVHLDTEVLVAAPREIWSETRCFVIDGRVVTASLYKRGDRVQQVEVVDGPALDFARSCIADWQPSRAFVLDVASTPRGWKVIEVNCINAAGFYACDMQRLVIGFEEAFGA